MATSVRGLVAQASMIRQVQIATGQHTYMSALSRSTTRLLRPSSILLARSSGCPYIRPFATHTSKPDGNEILAAQRLHRPVAPHLSIYRPQITWYASALNRITGALLSGAFYSYFAVYLVGPVLGWHVGSMTLAASFGALPVLAKVAVKFGLALPFAFHSLNGIRHLVWDFGLQMKNKQVAFTGWLVIGLSVVGSMVLALV